MEKIYTANAAELLEVEATEIVELTEDELEQVAGGVGTAAGGAGPACW